MMQPHFLVNILDVHTSKIIFELNSACKYNISATIPDIREIIFYTPYLLIENDYIVQCFNKGLIPITILSQCSSIIEGDRILLDRFIQRMKEIE